MLATPEWPMMAIVLTTIMAEDKMETVGWDAAPLLALGAVTLTLQRWRLFEVGTICVGRAILGDRDKAEVGARSIPHARAGIDFIAQWRCATNF